MNSKKKKVVEDDRLISKPEVLDRVGVTFPMPTQNKFHLDKRAGKLLDADPAPEADDQLLTTREVAAYLGMSEQWVTLGRSKKYGPPFVRVGTAVCVITSPQSASGWSCAPIPRPPNIRQARWRRHD